MSAETEGASRETHVLRSISLFPFWLQSIWAPAFRAAAAAAEQAAGHGASAENPYVLR